MFGQICEQRINAAADEPTTAKFGQSSPATRLASLSSSACNSALVCACSHRRQPATEPAACLPNRSCTGACSADCRTWPEKSPERSQIQIQILNQNNNNNIKSAQTRTEEARESCIIANMRPQNRSANFKTKLLNLIIINTIFSQLGAILTNYIAEPGFERQQALGLPRLLFADAIECHIDGDCGNKEKICHETKCICARDRPIDSSEGCLPHGLIGEQCYIGEQCLGNSHCVENTCSCLNDEISLYNPSTKIFYCHPKRRLNEECNYDSQCPTNSYCSTSKSGCLCQNGYAPIEINGNLECVAKFCSNSSSCESEFYHCDDNKCKCLATHFDPTTARCYKFGSTGGKASDELLNSTNVITDDGNGIDNFHTILRDLTENSDRMWLVLIILITSSIVLIVLIFMLIRKCSLGYCWTAHKKEYEPNNKTQAKNGYFNKNSINNKSFRQKNGELEDEDADLANDKNDGTAFLKPADKNHSFIKVNIKDNHYDTDNSFNGNNHYHQEATTPLKTSTSTPV